MSSSKPKALGRGLSALMADVEIDREGQNISLKSESISELQVPIEKIHPNPEQPRRSFKSGDLDDLANSIRSKGVIQPLIVRRHPKKEEEYEIVAGERRWRASQLAKLHELPVIVRDFSDLEVLEVAIIENIQRADLNPIEEAAGYKQLMQQFKHTQEQIAEELGKSRSYIANLLRLLSLPADVQSHLEEGRLTIGHARSLITSQDASRLAQVIISKRLSVRQTESLVKNSDRNKFTLKEKKSNTKNDGDKDADTKALERDLSSAIGMKVQVNHKVTKQSGHVIISYSSLDQLDDICRLLNSSA